MEKHCKICDKIKLVDLFYKKTARVCKDCRNAARRTGKPNLGRFQKGHTSWLKGKNQTEEARNKMSLTKIGKGKGRRSYNAREWRKKILERDKYKCTNCGTSEKLHCHHIKPWKDFPELRFDMDNGKVLCNACHKSIEYKGHEVSQETREKISKKLIGHKNNVGIPKSKPVWNKGTKGICKAWNKGMTGFVPWNRGIKHSLEHVEKLKLAWIKRKQRKLKNGIS